MSEYIKLCSSYLRETEGEVNPEKLEYMRRNRLLLLRVLYSLKTLYERILVGYPNFTKEFEGISHDRLSEIVSEELEKRRRGRPEREFKAELLMLLQALKIRLFSEKHIDISIVSPMEIPDKSLLDVFQDIAIELDELIRKYRGYR